MSIVLKSQLSLSAVVSISLLATLLGCEPSSTSASKSFNNTLVYCSEGSPQSLNPQTSTSGTTVDATSGTIFNQLLDYDPGTTNLRASLATDWEIDDSATRYRFTIRQGVAFHSNQYFKPTRFLNADDIVFSINRQRLKQHPLHRLNDSEYPYFTGQGLNQLIKSVEKINDFQVKIILKRPESPFLSIVATPFFPIQSKEYAEELTKLGKIKLFDKHPIGTGPFQFLAYEADSYLRFKRFAQHFAFQSEFEDLVFSITPDPAMRFARFSAGECDIMRHPLPIHNQIASQDNTITSIETAALNVAYWSFNTEKAPLNNSKIREALNLAVNRKAILRSVYNNQAVLAESPIGPGSWAYDSALAKTLYNPEKAKQLLSEAGYSNGFELDIWAMPVQRAYNPNARKMAEMIQQDLLEIGVKANIVSYQWGTFLQKVRSGQHQSVLLGWSADNADPDNFLTPLLSCAASVSGSNNSRWCDPTFDKIILDARIETAQDKRRQLYQKAQEIFSQKKPWLPIAHTPNHLLINDSIKNVSVSPLGTISFESVSKKLQEETP